MSMDMYNIVREERQREMREEAERQRRIMGWPAGRRDKSTYSALRREPKRQRSRERGQ